MAGHVEYDLLTALRLVYAHLLLDRVELPQQLVPLYHPLALLGLRLLRECQ